MRCYIYWFCVCCGLVCYTGLTSKRGRSYR
nr:MAG TPA: hypothetical protein [Caudoviricetes sp.]